MEYHFLNIVIHKWPYFPYFYIQSCVHLSFSSICRQSLILPPIFFTSASDFSTYIYKITKN